MLARTQPRSATRRSRNSRLRSASRNRRGASLRRTWLAAWFSRGSLTRATSTVLRQVLPSLGLT